MNSNWGYIPSGSAIVQTILNDLVTYGVLEAEWIAWWRSELWQKGGRRRSWLLDLYEEERWKASWRSGSRVNYIEVLCWWLKRIGPAPGTALRYTFVYQSANTLWAKSTYQYTMMYGALLAVIHWITVIKPMWIARLSDLMDINFYRAWTQSQF